MKKLVLAVLLYSSVMTAQTFREDLDNPDFNQIRQQGQIFSVQLSPANPIRIFVVGREEANYDAKSLKLNVYRIDGNKKQEIPTIRRDGYFFLPENIAAKDLSKLQIKPNLNGKTESFEINLR